jgi:hypothetical protein
MGFGSLIGLLWDIVRGEGKITRGEPSLTFELQLQSQDWIMRVGRIPVAISISNKLWF